MSTSNTDPPIADEYVPDEPISDEEEDIIFDGAYADSGWIYDQRSLCASRKACPPRPHRGKHWCGCFWLRRQRSQKPLEFQWHENNMLVDQADPSEADVDEYQDTAETYDAADLRETDPDAEGNAPDNPAEDDLVPNSSTSANQGPTQIGDVDSFGHAMTADGEDEVLQTFAIDDKSEVSIAVDELQEDSSSEGTLQNDFDIPAGDQDDDQAEAQPHGLGETAANGEVEQLDVQSKPQYDGPDDFTFDRYAQDLENHSQVEAGLNRLEEPTVPGSLRVDRIDDQDAIQADAPAFALAEITQADQDHDQAKAQLNDRPDSAVGEDVEIEPDHEQTEAQLGGSGESTVVEDAQVGKKSGSQHWSTLTGQARRRARRKNKEKAAANAAATTAAHPVETAQDLADTRDVEAGASAASQVDTASQSELEPIISRKDEAPSKLDVTTDGAISPRPDVTMEEAASSGPDVMTTESISQRPDITIEERLSPGPDVTMDEGLSPGPDVAMDEGPSPGPGKTIRGRPIPGSEEPLPCITALGAAARASALSKSQELIQDPSSLHAAVKEAPGGGIAQANNSSQDTTEPQAEQPWFTKALAVYTQHVQEHYERLGLDPADPSTMLDRKRKIPRSPPGLVLGCTSCGKTEHELKKRLTLLCSNCPLGDGFMRYCSKECQRRDWPRHKRVCGIPLDPVSRTPVQLSPAHLLVDHWNIARKVGHCTSQLFKIAGREAPARNYKLIIDSYRAFTEASDPDWDRSNWLPGHLGPVPVTYWLRGYKYEGLKKYLERTLVPEIMEKYLPDYWNAAHRDK